MKGKVEIPIIADFGGSKMPDIYSRGLSEGRMRRQAGRNIDVADPRIYYRANSVNLDSRTTVILISPG